MEMGSIAAWAGDVCLAIKEMLPRCLSACWDKGTGSHIYYRIKEPKDKWWKV